MGWHGHLELHYTRDGERCTAMDRHSGPLRVLKRLYPEGPGICHHVLVHPPGGIVGGDVLEVQASLDAGTHAVITTPGAARFYRSEGAEARQSVHLQLAGDARLEWLPMETIAQRGCIARNELRLDLEPDAQTLGWDLLALGLPARQEPFDHGVFHQHLELPGHWLERGSVQGTDALLLDSALGWAGHRVLATLWFAAGRAWPTELRDALLDAAREVTTASGLAAGVTAAHPRVIVLRVLTPQVEPAMQLLKAVRGGWRHQAWGLGAEPPRIWRT